MRPQAIARSAQIALAMLALLGARAHAQPSPDDAADRAFREAGQLAAAGAPEAIAAFEALGAARPVSRWTDDAWAEAARLAENAREFARARHDLEQLLALGTQADDRLRARAEGALARLADITGAGQWDAISAEHERLASVIYGGGDPRAALEVLEALARANPSYPRISTVRLTLAVGWEGEGEGARALTWFGAAAEGARDEPGQHVRLEYARALVRAGDLDAAATELEALDPGKVDRGGAAQVREALATARRRAWIRRALWLVLASALVLAAAALRRDRGGWRAAGRALIRPPTEAVFLVPVALVLAVVAHSGNPLVARAVTLISVAGVLAAWLSGARLEAARTRTGALGAGRLALHVAVVVIALGAAVYLIVDRGHLLDLIGETVRGGPAMR